MSVILNIALLLALVLFTSSQAHARPVSYPGGWTVMSYNDVDSNATHIHYSPSARHSIGWRHEYFRDSSVHVDSAQLNYLVKRWNEKGSQANIYFKSGAGIAYDGDNQNGAVFARIAGDWETRRYFLSYDTHALKAGDLESFVKHHARIGIAPYEGDYGDLHTWLMLQADYDAGAQDTFSLTPLVRLFSGPTLLEAGYNLDKGVMLNFIQRF